MLQTITEVKCNAADHHMQSAASQAERSSELCEEQSY
jgi:hypothetical protein